MKINLINNLKETILFLISVSTIATLFFIQGYYLYYKIDILTFMSFEDLALIFVSKTWILTFVIISIYFASHFFLELLHTNSISNYIKSYFNKIMMKDIVAILFVLFLVIIIGVVFYFFFTPSYTILSFFGLCSIAFGFLNKFLRKLVEVKEIELDRKSLTKELIFYPLYIFIGFPFTLGYIIAQNLPFENKSILIVYENDVFLKIGQPGNNTLYVGKTKNYIFLFDNKIKTNKIINLDKVKSIEFN